MRIAFIGGGHMAGAVVAGLHAKNPAGTEVWVCDRHEEKRRALEERYAAKTFPETGPWLRDADVVVLAVKPQTLRETCRAIAEHLAPGACVVSFAAGVRAGAIGQWLGRTGVVRVMPNTPAMAGVGFSGLWAPEGTRQEHRGAVEAMMQCVGRTAWLGKEDDINRVIGGPGSGVAYVYHFLHCLEAALEAQGTPGALAHDMALTTVEGAVRLARESGEDFAELRRHVATPGGTTIEAVRVLEKRGMEGMLAQAVDACMRRARELENQLSVP